MTALLDQLTAAAATAAASDADGRQVLEIALDHLEPDPDQPRRTFEHLGDLAASLQALGVQQPLLVRRHPDGGDRYLVVAGERRLRAAKTVGLERVPCLVQEPTDPGHRLVVQLTENLQRADVPVLEVAEALRRVLEVLACSKSELARLLGKSPAFVSKHLALLKAEGSGREALEEGRIRSTETHRYFTRLPIERQEEMLAKARGEGRAIGRGDVAGAEPSPPTPPTEARITLELTADQLVQLLRLLDVEPPASSTELVPTILRLLSVGEPSKEIEP